MILLNEDKARIFLAQNKIANCEIKKVAGDASFRSYYRIFFEGKTFILMFAPPSHEDIHPFIKIDKFLVENNFSAPKIFAVDEKEGFILLEDFGDESYTKALAKALAKSLEKPSTESSTESSTKSLAKNNAQELQLYKNACDALLELHQISAPSDVEIYNNAVLFREVLLFVDWYLPHVKKIELNLAQKSCFKHLFFELFDLLNREKQVLVLRDYHADNLMILSDRKNYKSVGMLDFQDALIGSRAYDLVSLLEDARRDVDEKTAAEILKYYIDHGDVDAKTFQLDYEILSLQRNIKIMGIFARLAVRDSKPHYLNLLPRVEKYVLMRLESQNEVFAQIAQFLKKFI